MGQMPVNNLGEVGTRKMILKQNKTPKPCHRQNIIWPSQSREDLGEPSGKTASRKTKEYLECPQEWLAFGFA